MRWNERKMRILQDTREQNPLSWATFPNIQIQVDTLPCGDYTLIGHDMPGDDHSIIIERKKNCQELVGNLGAHFDTFENEMLKMQQYKNKMILVCSDDDFADLYDKQYTRIHPNFAYKQLAVLQAKYQVPTLFLGNRLNVETFIFRVFKEILELSKADI